MKVGFIGLGVMGSHISQHIHHAGYEVTVWNRNRTKMEAAATWGATLAESPKDIAHKSNLIFTCVGDTPDVREVVLGENGVLKGAKKGTILIDLSTISPEATRSLYHKAQKEGIAMLDAPITGGDVGAREGTLSMMVGGDKTTLEEVLPVLKAFTKSIVYCGPSGAGQSVKICNQILCGLNLLGMVEAMGFAKKAGIDLETMIQVTTTGAGNSWALSNLGPRIIKDDFDPGFSVRLQQKDLRIALQEAENLGIPLIGTAVVQQLLRSIQAYGEDQLGTQSLMKVIERLANKECL